jgi:hypothetical protein
MGTIQARFLHREFFEFQPTHKIFFDANHQPQASSGDPAIWSRIKLIPFTVSIPDEEKDRKLGEKLRAELSGTLAWAVCGCLEWLRHGLGEPAEVRDATQAYRDEMDTFKDFLGGLLCGRGRSDHSGQFAVPRLPTLVRGGGRAAGYQEGSWAADNQPVQLAPIPYKPRPLVDGDQAKAGCSEACCDLRWLVEPSGPP